MDAEELLVHDSGQRQRTERLDAGFIDRLGVLVLTFELECEVVGQVTTFVVASQQPKSIGIPNLQTPNVKNALSEVNTTCKLNSDLHTPRC